MRAFVDVLEVLRCEDNTEIKQHPADLQTYCRAVVHHFLKELMGLLHQL